MPRKLRQVIDLYTTGKVVPLKGGTPVWVQPLNPFEQDTARQEAMVAKSRLTLAIKEFGSDEQAKVRMFFFEDGLEGAREILVDSKMAENTPKLLDKLRIDPEWTERLAILDRGSENTARPLEQAEAELITKINADFATEFARRLNDERAYLTAKYVSTEEAELWEEYLEWFISRRGSDVLMNEYNLHQIMFGVRWCAGTDHGEGTWTHENCESHLERMFASIEEVRSLPEDLLQILATATDEIDMTAREAKNSDRQGSSSGSSPLPSEGEASTASTPSETQPEPHGSSSSPSPTPSLSSVGAS